MTGLDKGEMFRDLSPDEPEAGERAAPTGKKDDYRPVIPVPGRRARPRLEQIATDRKPPAIRWRPGRYHTAENAALPSYVVAVEAQGLLNDPKKKVIRPATWDGTDWRLRGHACAAPPLQVCRPSSSAPTGLLSWSRARSAPTQLATIFHITSSPPGPTAAMLGKGRTGNRSRAAKCCWSQTPMFPAARRWRLLPSTLHSLGCKVRVYLPEGDDGNDIADWIEADDAGTARERIDGRSEAVDADELEG